MPIDIIVGGQGGDEGKGKISAYLAIKNNYDVVLRVPSPQAGHSTYFNGKRVGLALLPCGLVNERSRVLIGAGALISIERLLTGFYKKMPDGSQKFIPPEIPATGLTSERLGIDYRATIVTSQHKQNENENSHLMGKIGSVGEGIGPCRVDKLMRKNITFARDILELQPYLTDTKAEMFAVNEKGGTILAEGDHGAKIDLIHGEYPYVTSRATNAAGFLSEAGLGPRDTRDIYVVMKPYPTRVAAGPLEEEVRDEKVLRWAEELGGETGTVSGRKRRMGRFEWNNISEVIKMNSANKLVITHMDCPDFVWNSLGYENGEEFIEEIKNKICSKYPYPKIALLSYGPKTEDIKEI